MEDPTRDYTRIQPAPRHRWSVAQHVTLAFLDRTYTNSWNDKRAVFNSYFSSDLRNPRGLSSAALSAMLYDMQKGITGKLAIKLLKQTAFSFDTPPTLVNQGSIERTAIELGIHLIKRSPEALSTATQQRKQQRKAKRKAVALDESLSESESAPRTPKKRQHCEPAPQTPHRQSCLGVRNGLLTPPATVGRDPVLTPNRLPATINQPWPPTHRHLPLVAYRAFSTRSQGSYSEERGFCAGAFVDSDVPLAPDPQSQEYIDQAKRVK